MFKKIYGDVIIEVKKDVPKRGTCLCAQQGEHLPIYMDICGFAIPDGSNAYMYGNKLIIVTRWAGMSSDEIEAVKNEEVRMVVAPFRFIQMGMQIADFGWSDVFFTLYHCGVFSNDENKPVDEIILIFADKSSGEIVADRRVPLQGGLDGFFRQALINSHKVLYYDFARGEFMAAANSDLNRDFCDVVYDQLWSVTKENSAQFRQFPNIGKIPLGIYFTIDKDGEIINLYQQEE
jgi:hypothetical protein